MSKISDYRIVEICQKRSNKAIQGFKNMVKIRKGIDNFAYKADGLFNNYSFIRVTNDDFTMHYLYHIAEIQVRAIYENIIKDLLIEDGFEIETCSFKGAEHTILSGFDAVKKSEIRIGFFFSCVSQLDNISDIYIPEILENYFNEHKMDYANIILFKPDCHEKLENYFTGEKAPTVYAYDNLNIKKIFDKYFGNSAYPIFHEYMVKFSNEISFLMDDGLSLDNMFWIKKKSLLDLRNLLTRPIDNDDTNKGVFVTAYKQFWGGGLYRVLLYGSSDFSKSFITSEWLYRLMKDNGNHNNFDYTAIIIGYLKSIEQLIYALMKSRIGNGYKIAKRSEKGKGRKWININGDDFYYEYEDLINNKSIKHTSTQLGTAKFFFNQDKKVLNVGFDFQETIVRMIEKFATNDRNGFLHTENLYNWEKVESVRKEAIQLYFYILGTLIMEPEDKVWRLTKEVEFDAICNEIIDDGIMKGFLVYGKEKKRIFRCNNIDYYPERYTLNGLIHYDELELEVIIGLDEEEHIQTENIIMTKNSLPEEIIMVNSETKRSEYIYCKQV